MIRISNIIKAGRKQTKVVFNRKRKERAQPCIISIVLVFLFSGLYSGEALG